MEKTLEMINKQFIQLDDDMIEANNRILHKVIDDFLVEFKKDALFENLYERFFFGGSYYDNLKVGKPNEFDIDIVFKLPVNAAPKIHIDNNFPGYVQVELTDLDSLQRMYYPPSYKDMKKLVNADHYLSVPNIMRWFQGMVDKAKNALNSSDYKIAPNRIGKGPAATLTITYRNHVFDMDLVPCFKFTLDKWPQNCRASPQTSPGMQVSEEFLVVPKPKDDYSNTYLRLSFQGQEQFLLKDKGPLKAAIRLLKFLRDQYNDNYLKSYFIKTIALWGLDNRTIPYNKQRLSVVFIKLMELTLSAIEQEMIPYYWNKDFNLLEKTPTIYLHELANRLRRQLTKIRQGNEQEILNVFKVPNIESEGNACSAPEDLLQIKTLTNEFGRTSINTHPDSLRERAARNRTSMTSRVEERDSDTIGNSMTQSEPNINQNYRWGMVAAGVGLGAIATYALTRALRNNRD